MKIAVCGSGMGGNPEIEEKAKQIGVEITKSKNTILTGGCLGYPYAALRGALLENGKAINYSPAADKEEHRIKYAFPLEENAEYIFTGKGIPGRNLSLIQAADAVIILEGQIGTLNEFTIAFHEKKKVGVLQGTKISELIPKITKVCDKGGNCERISYSTDPKELIKKITS